MSLQQFSLFHETSEEKLQNWHRPYAALFTERGPVLDVGCGPGYMADVLTEMGVDSLGIDLDPAMVELSKKRGRNAVLGSQDAFPQVESGFGGVHISHVVEHLWGDELEKMLSNSLAVLRPSGILIIRTPNWDNPFVRERLFWMDHTHKRPYPRELLVRMLKDMGMLEVTSGCEPTGMNDTFVVAANPPFATNDVPPLKFLRRDDGVSVIRRTKGRMRDRLQGFLGITTP
ncbi:methyltransferase type 11 [Rhodopirellula sallentina SM41]|uniref:Methyltransferase type 11 n=2 Tax=Rhodopirellula TaxID=265488 RepID=M5U5D9_9BACT|nr:methyltransferase type 11 [Rhodopirellula sallentina SM41]